MSENDRRVVITGPELRARVSDVACALQPAAPWSPTRHHPGSHGRRPPAPFGRCTAVRGDPWGWPPRIIRCAWRRSIARRLREQQMQRLATEAGSRPCARSSVTFCSTATIGYLIQNAPPARSDAAPLDEPAAWCSEGRAEFSTLDEELDLVTSYLDIERARCETTAGRDRVSPSVRRTIDAPAAAARGECREAWHRAAAGRRCSAHRRVRRTACTSSSRIRGSASIPLPLALARVWGCGASPSACARIATRRRCIHSATGRAPPSDRSPDPKIPSFAGESGERDEDSGRPRR